MTKIERIAHKIGAHTFSTLSRRQFRTAKTCPFPAAVRAECQVAALLEDMAEALRTQRPKRKTNPTKGGERG